jgi:hypothetical protein
MLEMMQSVMIWQMLDLLAALRRLRCAITFRSLLLPA